MQLKMKELPILERPYEKLEIYGAEMLSNAELLAIIIKTGNKKETAVALAQKILNLNKNYNKNDLRFLQEISIEEFKSIKGIGEVKAIQLKSVCELAKRMGQPLNSTKIIIRSPQDVANLMMEELRYEKKEEARVIILNIKNVVQKIVKVSQGRNKFCCYRAKRSFSRCNKNGST